MTQYILELTRVIVSLRISLRSNPLSLRTRPVGADVASMTHTATLSSANKVQLVQSFAIAGFAEELLNESCCLSPVIS